MWIDGPDGKIAWKHGLGRIESQDFIRWSTPELIMFPDDQDHDYVEFHTGPVFYYNGYYFMLNQILNRNKDKGCIDIELGISHDGKKFERPFRDEFFIDKGEKGTFDSGSIFTNSTPVVMDNEIRFYYGAYSSGATGGLDKIDLVSSGLGMSHIKKDRFGGIHSPEGVGQITLKHNDMMHCRELLLNADTTGGSVLAEILDSSGYLIPGYTVDDAIPVTDQDNLASPLLWKKKSLFELGGGEFIIRLYLRGKAKVFALSLRY
jgi:hypothetical protein